MKAKKGPRRRQGGRSDAEGRCPTEREEVQEDGEGRWQRMKVYTHNDPAALYRADKAVWQQMRLHEADPDMVAYQEMRLIGKDNVVCAQMYDKEGESTSASGHKGCRCWCAEASALFRTRKWERGDEGRCMMWRRSMDRWSSSTAMSRMGGGSKSMWRS